MDVCMATWARSAPGTLTITGEGMASHTLPIAPPGRRPDHTVLHGTGWHAYPDSCWQEDDLCPGVWEVAVFPDAAAGVTFGNRKLT